MNLSPKCPNKTTTDLQQSNNLVVTLYRAKPYFTSLVLGCHDWSHLTDIIRMDKCLKSPWIQFCH